MLDALDAIPDLFKTFLNVTADLSAATILTAPVPQPANEFGAEPAGSIAAVE